MASNLTQTGLTTGKPAKKIRHLQLRRFQLNGDSSTPMHAHQSSTESVAARPPSAKKFFGYFRQRFIRGVCAPSKSRLHPTAIEEAPLQAEHSG